MSEVTATKLYVNLAMADRAAEVAALEVDGVGLLRGEFMVVDALGGRHPRALIADGRSDEFISRMGAQLGQIAGAFGTRPVVYRTMDFRSNEFRGLTGGEQFEPVEQNPMIGYRGCYRYIKDPETFALELETLGRVREEFAEPAGDDPVRQDEVGTGGLPGGHRRKPARTAAGARQVGDGRGPVGDRPDSRLRRTRHRRACRSAATT